MKYFLSIAIFLTLNVRGQFVVKDIFIRNLNGESIVLVDWEGHMANPAIKLSIQPPR